MSRSAVDIAASGESPQHPVGKAGEVVASAGRRLAVAASEWLDDWYVSHSPRNGNGNAEGPWEEWVALAREILRLEEVRVAALPAPPEPGAEGSP